tara:strand:+ start:14110 stop:15474 length:1365 start_codon:yes stop_codon:yes gene_type:complete
MKKEYLYIILVVCLSCSTWDNPKPYVPPTALTIEETTVSEFPPLPYIEIDTYSVPIVDEPKIKGFLEIYQGEEKLEEHNIGIEIRGSSSQFFDKKSYGFETWDETGEDLDVSFAGYPEEEDWILYGPFSDKSLIRNVLIYNLSNEIGQYATKTKFYNLEINKQFLGVYVLMEKIKRDKNRVNISKNKPEDISGGYIIKIDKPTGDGDSFNSDIAFMSEYTSAGIKGINKNPVFLYEYPKNEDISSDQKEYIQNYIQDFENALASENFQSEEDGYKQFINTDTFIDFFLLNEISRNVDGYRISTFMNKDKGGKLNMGPIWDFNIAFGNANYCEAELTSGWAMDFNKICPQDGMHVPFWWNRLLEDPDYVLALKQRWSLLRSNQFSNEFIMTIIDDLKLELEKSDASTRNFGKWLILGKYIWPNNFIGNKYSEEIDYLKQWIEKRLSWMDNEIDSL